jgi:ABC-type cobalamin/Fe3+-siderophores transport system ATPase subunit
VLDGGQVVADGSPAAVLTRERVRSVFGVDVALTGGAASVAPAAATPTGAA